MSYRHGTTPSRDTLRKYIGAFLGSLKDGHADPEDVRAVLTELLLTTLPSYAGEGIKTAAQGYYWRVKLGVSAHPCIAYLERDERYLTLTTDGNSDYAIYWPLVTDGDGGAYAVEDTDFMDITLYGPLVPPATEGTKP